jgi:hypothetical protein
MLSIGSKIQGKLIEEVEADYWIVSFRGQLIQVKNSTGQQFRPGQMLNLEVTKTQPLALKILAPPCKKKLKLDVRI